MTKIELLPVKELGFTALRYFSEALFEEIDVNREALSAFSWASTVTQDDVMDHLTIHTKGDLSSDALDRCAELYVMAESDFVQDHAAPRFGCVGLLSIKKVGRCLYQIGYWVAGSAQNKGVGKAAVAQAIKKLQLHTIGFRPEPLVRAVPYEGNDASRALLESLGFERVCTLNGECFYERLVKLTDEGDSK
jgi:RimJ/RimL family protein N-acetyltransferase